MDLSLVSADDWSVFGAVWPGARAFLLSKSLEGELRVLRQYRADGRLNAWRERRLAELEELFHDVEVLERGGKLAVVQPGGGA